MRFHHNYNIFKNNCIFLEELLFVIILNLELSLKSLCYITLHRPLYHHHPSAESLYWAYTCRSNFAVLHGRWWHLYMYDRFLIWELLKWKIIIPTATLLPKGCTKHIHIGLILQPFMVYAISLYEQSVLDMIIVDFINYNTHQLYINHPPCWKAVPSTYI